MTKITLALNVQIEADSAQDVLPALQQQLHQLITALQSLAEESSDLVVSLPHIEIDEPPDWSAPRMTPDFGGGGHA